MYFILDSFHMAEQHYGSTGVQPIEPLFIPPQAFQHIITMSKPIKRG